MKNILCLFGLHKMRILKLEHYKDISWGGNALSTKIIKVCSRGCGKIKDKNYYGLNFELSDLDKTK